MRNGMYGKGGGNGWGGGTGWDSGDNGDKQTTIVETPETTEITAESIADMLYVLEEEKLAGDIYEAFYDLYGAQIFDNIAASEDNHFDAMLNQAELLGIDTDVFVFEPAGTYVNPEVQELYDTLYEYGSTSLEAALEVGVIIEETDIADLKAAAEDVAGTQLESVYDSLLAGSMNHLEAFESVLG